jgi:hypothetical protein
MAVFADAYNKFGEAKMERRIAVNHKSPRTDKPLHKWRYPTFSLLDFI